MVCVQINILGYLYVWKENWTEEKTDEDYKLVLWFKPEQINFRFKTLLISDSFRCRVKTWLLCILHTCSRYISKTILLTCIFNMAKQFRGKKSIFVKCLIVHLQAEGDQSRVTNWLVLFDVFLWHLAAACPLFSAYQCCSDRCICVTCLAALSADKWKKTSNKIMKYMNDTYKSGYPAFVLCWVLIWGNYSLKEGWVRQCRNQLQYFFASACVQEQKYY